MEGEVLAALALLVILLQGLQYSLALLGYIYIGCLRTYLVLANIGLFLGMIGLRLFHCWSQCEPRSIAIPTKLAVPLV